MRTNRYTQEQIFNMFRQGMTTKQVMDKTGYASSTVYAHYRNFRLYGEKGKPEPPRRPYPFAEAHYDSGVTFTKKTRIDTIWKQ